MTNVRYVDSNYFHALGIQVKAGRIFGDRDRQRHVAVVNERDGRSQLAWTKRDWSPLP